MEIKEELKEADIKNGTCYYFDDIIIFWDKDIDISVIVLDKNYIKKTTKIF